MRLLYAPDGDGWYPRVSSDGAVCFGDLATRAWHIGGGEWAAIPGRQSQFLHPGVVTFTRELSPTTKRRYLRDLSTGDVVPMLGDDVALVAGNDFVASDGHWASWLADGGRLVIDGRVIGHGYRGVRMRWPWVVSLRDDTQQIVWFRDGVEHGRAPQPAGAHRFEVSARGAVTAGYNGPVTLSAIGLVGEDVTITPWRREAPQVIVNAGGIEWAWTSTEAPNGRRAVLGHPIRAAAEGQDVATVIVDGVSAAHFDVAYVADRREFVVAACSDVGRLQVWSVPIDEARGSLRAWGGADVQAPPPVGVPVATPKALGYFFDYGRYGTFAPARNCTILRSDLWATGDGPMPDAQVEPRMAEAIDAAGLAFVDVEDLRLAAVRARWAKILGVISHEPASAAQAAEDATRARHAMRQFGLAGRPVVAILTPGHATDAAYDHAVDAVAPECYFDAPAGTYAETLRAARLRYAEIAAAHAVPVFLLVQAYDRSDGPGPLSNAWERSPVMLEALQQAANEALGLTRIAGLWWFAYARPGGVRTYPRLEAWHAAQVAVTPAPTPIRDPKPTQPETPMPMTFTLDQIEAILREVPDHTDYLGARQRFRDEVLLPRDRVTSAVDGEGRPANASDMMTGGAAMLFELGASRERLISRFRHPTAPPVDHLVKGLLGAADDYRRAVGLVVDGGQPPTAPGTVDGRLTVERGRLRGTSGFETYVGVSAFSLVGHAMQGRKSEVHRQLNEAAGHPVRVFAMLDPLNGGFGPVARFTPDDAGWDEAMDFVVHEAGFRGSRVQINIFADAQRLYQSVNDRRRVLDRVARRYRDVEHVYFRIANEPYQNGWSAADDASLLDLARQLADVLGHNHFAIGDVPDNGSESGSPDQREAIHQQAQLSTILVVHNDRAEQAGRERPVEHMKSVAETYRNVAPDCALIFDEPRGFASQRQPGRRDNRPAIAFADAGTAAVLGCAYTYHRIAEQDPATPGLDDALGIAQLVPTSPDYRFENANTGNAWVRRFSGWDKVRPTHNGTMGWAIAKGPVSGSIEVADGWRYDTVAIRTAEGVAVGLYKGTRA